MIIILKKIIEGESLRIQVLETSRVFNFFLSKTENEMMLSIFIQELQSIRKVVFVILDASVNFGGH